MRGHALRCLILVVLLHGLSFSVDAAEKVRPLSSSKAVKLVRKYLNETDEAKKKAMLEETAHTEGSFKILRKAMIRRSYPGMKPGVHKDLDFPLPAHVSDKPIKYAIQVPSNYKPNRLWPLVIGLHGGGNNTGSGKQHMSVMSGHVPGAIVVCPTSVDLGMNYYWRNPKNEEMLDLLIKKMTTVFPIDPDRIYLSGYSMGGIGTYYLAPRMNDRFAAVSPGGGSWNAVYWPQLTNTPVYVLHGRKDMRGKRFTDFPNAENAAKCLKEAGCPFELRATDDGHDMNNAEMGHMGKWLLKHKRNPYPKRIVHASPCAKDFMVPMSPSPPDRWLTIDEIGSEKLALMDKVALGGLNPEKKSFTMGVLDATWVEENVLEVEAKNVKSFRVLLAEQIVNFKKPLQIIVNGKTVYDGPIKSSLAYGMKYVDERRDLGMIFVGEVKVDL